MNQSFIGTIFMFGFNFAPYGWALCNGQLQQISQNTALFSLLGTTYGGDGVNTFALPDLQGRVPIHQGTGIGLSTYVIGQLAGNENTTLAVNNLPSHNHVMNAVTDKGTTSAPTGAFLANTGVMDPEYINTGTTIAMNAGVVGNTTGGGQPFNNIQPYLVVNYCISLYGIFPSQN